MESEEISFGKDGSFQWTIQNFQEKRENCWIYSPIFTYNGLGYYIRFMKLIPSIICVRFSSMDSFLPNGISGTFQLRTDCNNESKLHVSTWNDKTGCFQATINFEFLSKNTGLQFPKHLTIHLWIRNIYGKEFSQSTQNSGGESRDHKRAIKNHASGTEDVPVTEGESECVETETKPIAASDKPSGNSGKLQEISRGVKWDIRLPPSKKSWNVLSPEFTCGRLKYYFRMYSSELRSDDIYLGFIVNITNFPLTIRWCMVVKRRGLAGLLLVMNGQRWVTMGYERQCYQHTHEVCIKRAELECYLSPDSRLTFVHYLSIGDMDEKQEASKQTDFEKQLTLRPTYPEELDYVHLIQKKPLDPSVEKFFSELPRDDKNDFIFAA